MTQMSPRRPRTSRGRLTMAVGVALVLVLLAPAAARAAGEGRGKKPAPTDPAPDPLPIACVGAAPYSGSCAVSFTLDTARTVTLTVTPGSDFTGYLAASILQYNGRYYYGSAASVSRLYVGDDRSSVAETVTLQPGYTYRLDVNAGLAQDVPTFRAELRQGCRNPLWVCVPYPYWEQGDSVSVPVAPAAGTFAGSVSAS